MNGPRLYFSKREQQSAARTQESTRVSEKISVVGSQGSQLPKKVPKICKVNEYIVFYDEVLGWGQFGTVVKAQLASDLVDNSDAKGATPTVRSTVDLSKQIFACKIFDLEGFDGEDFKQILTEM